MDSILYNNTCIENDINDMINQMIDYRISNYSDFHNNNHVCSFFQKGQTKGKCLICGYE